MATRTQAPGPVPMAEPSNGVALPPTPAQLQTTLDNGIWYALSLWPALHLACQNNWGGEATLDKKDWFAGHLSELLTQRPDTDEDDLAEVLCQVMGDEFDCNVEDESETEVARTIMRLRKSLVEERSLEVGRELERRWRNRGQMKMNIQVVDNEAEEEDDDEEEWNGFADGDGDVDMDVGEDAVPSLVPAVVREKVVPEVDEDGFTKVPSKKKR